MPLSPTKMKKISSVILGIILLTIVLLTSTYFLKTKNRIDREGLCKWPLCVQKKFSEVGYVNGIYNLDTEISIDSYFFSFSFAHPQVPIPAFKHVLFPIKNLDNVTFKINGKNVAKDIFLKKSFGAEVSVEGIEQIDLFGLGEAGSKSDYSVKSINILNTGEEIGEKCTNCNMFDNEFLSFKYGNDWDVVNVGGPFVTLRRVKYYNDENPKWCTNTDECDCYDIDKKCGFDIQLIISNTTRSEYGDVLPKNKSHKVFTKYNNSVFINAENGLEGARLFAEDKNKNILMTVNDHSLFWNGFPFAMENDSLMPYLILSTLKIK